MHSVLISNAWTFKPVGLLYWTFLLTGLLVGRRLAPASLIVALTAVCPLAQLGFAAWWLDLDVSQTWPQRALLIAVPLALAATLGYLMGRFLERWRQ